MSAKVLPAVPPKFRKNWVILVTRSLLAKIPLCGE